MIAPEARRSIAGWLAVAAVAVAVVAVVALGPIHRGPGFHAYADQRQWLGIPHAGDVLSNLAFVAVALSAWPGVRARGLPGAGAACVGVALIGVGSAIYHVAPRDQTLVLDWSAIAVTLALVVAAVVRDRLGARPGDLVRALGPPVAVLAVGWWMLSGGTAAEGGGDLAPYVAVQALGVALPPLVAIVAPGRAEPRWLLAATACFALARVCAAHDAGGLAALGVSGHSAKHVVAAIAAGCALRALAPRR